MTYQPRPNLLPGMPDVRRWAFYNIGARMCAGDTGMMHGPTLQHADLRRQPGNEPQTYRARVLAATDHIGRGTRNAR